MIIQPWRHLVIIRLERVANLPNVRICNLKLISLQSTEWVNVGATVDQSSPNSTLALHWSDTLTASLTHFMFIYTAR